MFVDQPIGVGWSPQGNETNVSSTAEAGDDFYKFITTFYSLKNFTMLHKYDLYLAGESYAGSYIPVFAQKIIENNGVTPIPLKGTFSPTDPLILIGIIIGDGWTHPESQA